MTDEEIKKQKRGIVVSSLISMGLIGSGLVLATHDEKLGLAVFSTGLIPLMIKPETFSLCNSKIKKLKK